jgi:DNA uptake protein ComE-like DNA-binding protein
VEASESETSLAKAEAGVESAIPYTLPGIGEKTVRKLVEGGFPTLEALTAATAAMLSELPGIGEKTAEKIVAAVRGEVAPAEGEI